LGLAPRPAEVLDRLDRQRGRADVAGLHRRPRQERWPTAVRGLNDRKLMDPWVGSSAGRAVVSDQTESRVADASDLIEEEIDLRDVDRHGNPGGNLIAQPGHRVPGEANGTVPGLAHRGEGEEMLVTRQAGPALA